MAMTEAMGRRRRRCRWPWALVLATCVCGASPPFQEWVAISPGGSGDANAGLGSVLSSRLAVDEAGNSYVTGWVDDGSSRDFLTQKFDPSGSLLWSATYDGPAHGWDESNALVLDHEGNVIVTGRSDGGGTGTDYATLKYDGATGAPLWSGGSIANGAARFSGSPENRLDIPFALAVDADGNVLVTGSSSLADVSDYATVKYDGQTGAALWAGGSVVDGAARYDGPAADSRDEARSIAVDAVGNVLVAGTSNYDYATLKYDGSTGEPLWSGGAVLDGASRYNGPGNSTDAVHALALDSAGNVFVTGYSAGSGSGMDYATIKYDAATGEPLWSGGAIVGGAARYDGPAGGDDSAHAIAVDAAGDVVVAGSSNGVGSRTDFTTLKYSGGTGAPLWSGGAIVDGAARYDGPAGDADSADAVALDPGGNVLVTGPSTGDVADVDYATLSYDGTTGAPSWSGTGIVGGAARYQGPGGRDDRASAVAIDASGAVVVAGTRRGLPNNDVGLVRYDSTGMQLWVVHEGITEGLAEFSYSNHRMMAVDAAGNAYVTATVDALSHSNIVTRKFGPDGALLWSAVYDAPGGRDDIAAAIALDGGGDVVVTGAATAGDATSPAYDYATIKYDGATGEPLWMGDGIVDGAAMYNGPGNAHDLPAALVVDGAGNVLVTGRSVGSGMSEDYATIKYDGATGAPLWIGGATSDGAARYDGPAGQRDAAIALALDSAGNVFVTGESDGTGTGGDFATLKYDGATGAPAWTGSGIVGGAARYNAAANSRDKAAAIVVDEDDNVVVTGASIGDLAAGFDYATIKYNGSTGAFLWSGGAIVDGVARYDNPDANLHDEATAVALDSAGNVIVAGFSEAVGTGADYAILKYDGSTGAPLWTGPSIQQGAVRFAGQGLDGRDTPYAVAVDGRDDVLVTGASLHADAGNDFATIRISGTDGTVAWTHAFDGGAGLGDQAYAIATAGDGSVRIGGIARAPQGFRIAVAKLWESGADVEVTKVAGRDAVRVGDVVVYSIMVANAGPDDVQEVALRDLPPAALVDVEWACVPAASSAACPDGAGAAGTGALDVTLPTLGAGEHLRYDLSAIVQGSVGAEVQNTASVAVPTGVFEPQAADNTSTASILLVPDGIFADGFEAAPSR